MATISIKRMKRLRNINKVTYVPKKGVIKTGIITLLKHKNEFVDMDEIRLFFRDLDNRRLHSTITYLICKGIIVRMYVKSRAFYGLPEFLD